MARLLLTLDLDFLSLTPAVSSAGHNITVTIYKGLACCCANHLYGTLHLEQQLP